MIASLPMYDRPETAGTLDMLWAEIRARLPFDAPAALTRGGDIWTQWQHPDLILSQTCGYPFRARLHGRVQLVAAPDNHLPGCAPGYYNSVLVVRTDDPRSRIADFAEAPFTYNEALSQSGWAAPQTHAAAQEFCFSNGVQTGAHVESARAVAEGRADIASLDALTWRLIQRHEGFAPALREIARTDPTPAPPFITGPGRDGAAVAAALAGALDALSTARRDVLSLHGTAQLDASVYLAVPNPPPPEGGAIPA